MVFGRRGPDDDESIGPLLSRLRATQGKSQLRVAELLCAASGNPTLTRHEISRWEREERIPSAFWLRWLAVVLDTALDDLEQAAAIARRQRDTATVTPGRSHAPTLRRSTGRRRDATTPHQVARPAIPWPIEGGENAVMVRRSQALDRPSRPRASTSVGPTGHASDVDPAWLCQRVAELRRLDDVVAGPVVVGAVHDELRRAWASVSQAGPRRSAHRRRLIIPVAELAQLAGWVAVDGGAPAPPLLVHRIALRAALAAGQPALAGHIAACLAVLSAETGRLRPARRLALGALRLAGPTASATARALLWLRVGEVAARCGDGSRRVSEQALACAERVFEQRDPQLDPDWLYWLDEPHFAALAGRCYALLGRHRIARPLLRSALDSGAIRLRAQAMTGAALAHAHADAGDLDAATAAAIDTVLVCVRAGSVRASRDLRALATRLSGPAADHAAVRRFGTVFAAAQPFLPDRSMTRDASRNPHPARVLPSS